MPVFTEGDGEVKVKSDQLEQTFVLDQVSASLPIPSLGVVHVDELAAALQKLGTTNISASELSEAIGEEKAQKLKVAYVVSLRLKFPQVYDVSASESDNPQFNPTHPSLPLFGIRIPPRRKC